VSSSADQPSQYALSAVAWLQLLHLADSALPIGTLAHSFGVESLTAEAGLTENGLSTFFAQWLSGAGKIEAAFCLRGCSVETEAEWQSLNEEFSSFKPVGETREASLRLGKRFLALAAALIEHPTLRWPGSAHLATSFGLAGAALEVAPEIAAAAYLHQCLFGAVSACQRLLPLGQSSAMNLLWRLKPRIIQTVEEARSAPLDELWNIQPTLDIASMRHPHLQTRLFIS
jgi:urease accessory protein